MTISLRANRRIQHSVEDHSHDQKKNGSFTAKFGMLVQIRFVTWWRRVGCFELREKEELRGRAQGLVSTDEINRSGGSHGNDPERI
ncbi:unnamed protein product [Malus baccata var. baccata]